MKRYRLLYADPPWAFGNTNTGGSMKSGSAAQYQTMGDAAIAQIPVQSVMHDDSLLFLWVPTSMMLSGLMVMRGWGYTFKSKIYWRKPYEKGVNGKLGMGFWVRNQVEELWICKRGDVRPAKIPLPNVIEHEPLAHSAKPEPFRELVSLVAASSFDQMGLDEWGRLELFGREDRRGWTVLGNEIDGVDIRVALAALANIRAGAL